MCAKLGQSIKIIPFKCVHLYFTYIYTKSDTTTNCATPTIKPFEGLDVHGVCKILWTIFRSPQTFTPYTAPAYIVYNLHSLSLSRRNSWRIMRNIKRLLSPNKFRTAGSFITILGHLITMRYVLDPGYIVLTRILNYTMVIIIIIVIVPYQNNNARRGTLKVFYVVFPS